MDKIHPNAAASRTAQPYLLPANGGRTLLKFHSEPSFFHRIFSLECPEAMDTEMSCPLTLAGSEPSIHSASLPSTSLPSILPPSPARFSMLPPPPPSLPPRPRTPDPGQPSSDMSDQFDGLCQRGQMMAEESAVPLSCVFPGPVYPTENQLSVAIGYCIRRDDGAYTRLIENLILSRPSMQTHHLPDPYFPNPKRRRLQVSDQPNNSSKAPRTYCSSAFWPVSGLGSQVGFEYAITYLSKFFT